MLMMIEGHTVDAVLDIGLRRGASFEVWSFVRGLTSCTFLFVSGFVSSQAMLKQAGAGLDGAVGRRLRRAAFLMAIGYALHYPMPTLDAADEMSAEQWRFFLQVDVLQCLAVMLCGLQALVLIGPRPLTFAITTLTGSAVLVVLTPWMWAIHPSRFVPGAIAAYASPELGSQFPIFPWGAYLLLGAGCGGLWFQYRKWQPAFTTGMPWMGITFIGLALVGSWVPATPFGPTDFWTTSPNQFLLRSGLVLLLAGAIARASARSQRLPFVAQAITRESLTIYATHLALVYGSPVNRGLHQRIGQTQPLVTVLVWVAVTCVAMTLLAVSWHWCKLRWPRLTVAARVALGGFLLTRVV